MSVKIMTGGTSLLKWWWDACLKIWNGFQVCSKPWTGTAFVWIVAVFVR